jgi:hypothetical protein
MNEFRLVTEVSHFSSLNINPKQLLVTVYCCEVV